MNVGDLVGLGRTSDVYAYGADAVVKVPHPDVPPDWPAFEAALTAAVQRSGVPAPRVLDLIEVEGRASVVFERVHGPSMWQQMIDAPQRARGLAADLAAIQQSLLSAGIPEGVPDFVDRLERKIQGATGLPEPERDEALALLADLPRGAALLHGDLHPGNVLLGSNGPVVIDWFDASIGHPVADIVRSSILMPASHPAEPRHLPGATAELLHTVHEAYIAEFSDELSGPPNIATWEAVVAAGRLAEDAESDERGLLALWERRKEAS